MLSTGALHRQSSFPSDACDFNARFLYRELQLQLDCTFLFGRSCSAGLAGASRLVPENSQSPLTRLLLEETLTAGPKESNKLARALFLGMPGKNPKSFSSARVSFRGRIANENAWPENWPDIIGHFIGRLWAQLLPSEALRKDLNFQELSVLLGDPLTVPKYAASSTRVKSANRLLCVALKSLLLGPLDLSSLLLTFSPDTSAILS